MRKVYILILTVAGLIAFGGCSGEQATENDFGGTVATAISGDEFLENIKYLADDELAGRGNGTEGLQKAADYIASNFEAAGVKPFNDSYFQSFEVQTGNTFGENNSFKLSAGDTSVELKVLDEYLPLSKGEEALQDAELVFAGYGINAPDKNYDDYADVDVEGKVVLVLDLEPQRDDKESVFDGSADSQYAQTSTKIIAARMKGAAGIIIFRGPKHIGEDGYEIPEAGPGFKVDEIGIPGLITTYEALKPVLDDAGLDIAAIQDKIDSDLDTQSRTINATASISVDVSPVMATVNNVVGYLPGTDAALKDEYLVIGAHYDHLGLGYRGSMAPDEIGEIHNGADDNASGTSGVMELAEYFAAEENRPRRSMIFLAFAGEEWGLLGSAHFVANPLVEKEQMVAMLNMDMIGRADNKKITVGGVGTAGMFKAIVEEAGNQFDVNITTQESGFASSDNASFTAKGIPALFYFTGTHGDYHKPSDDWDKIQSGEGEEIVKMVAATASKIANADEAPEYIDVSVDMSKMRNRGGKRPWFGSMPDFGYEGKGYKFNKVMEGSPAAEAGFQGGDIMIKFGDDKVDNIYDYTAALQKFQPGDEVDVTVLRDGEEVVSTVKLTRRGGN